MKIDLKTGSMSFSVECPYAEGTKEVGAFRLGAVACLNRNGLVKDRANAHAWGVALELVRKESSILLRAPGATAAFDAGFAAVARHAFGVEMKEPSKA